MESRGERIEKTRRETDKEVRGVVEGSANLVPEVNPETLEEEEERNETAELYEAVAEKYRKLYEEFALSRFFESEEGKGVIRKVKEYINSRFPEGKTSPINASLVIWSLSAILSTPEIREYFTDEEIKNWLVQIKDKRFKQMIGKDVKSDLFGGKTDSTSASWATWSLSAILSSPEIKKLFGEEEIKEWLVQIGDENFVSNVKKRVKSNLSESKINPSSAFPVIQSLFTILSVPKLKERFRKEEIKECLIQVGDNDFKQTVRENMNYKLSKSETISDNASYAIRSLSIIHHFSQSLSSEASRLRAEEYDKGGRKAKPSSPRLPVKAF